MDLLTLTAWALDRCYGIEQRDQFRTRLAESAMEGFGAPSGIGEGESVEPIACGAVHVRSLDSDAASVTGTELQSR